MAEQQAGQDSKQGMTILQRLALVGAIGIVLAIVLNYLR